jgi:hypothetical protein
VQTRRHAGALPTATSATRCSTGIGAHGVANRSVIVEEQVRHRRVLVGVAGIVRSRYSSPITLMGTIPHLGRMAFPGRSRRLVTLNRRSVPIRQHQQVEVAVHPVPLAQPVAEFRAVSRSIHNQVSLAGSRSTVPAANCATKVMFPFVTKMPSGRAIRTKAAPLMVPL